MLNFYLGENVRFTFVAQDASTGVPVNISSYTKEVSCSSKLATLTPTITAIDNYSFYIDLSVAQVSLLGTGAVTTSIKIKNGGTTVLENAIVFYVLDPMEQSVRDISIPVKNLDSEVQFNLIFDSDGVIILNI